MCGSAMKTATNNSSQHTGTHTGTHTHMHTRAPSHVPPLRFPPPAHLQGVDNVFNVRHLALVLIEDEASLSHKLLAQLLEFAFESVVQLLNSLVMEVNQPGLLQDK